MTLLMEFYSAPSSQLSAVATLTNLLTSVLGRRRNRSGLWRHRNGRHCVRESKSHQQSSLARTQRIGADDSAEKRECVRGTNRCSVAAVGQCQAAAGLLEAARVSRLRIWQHPHRPPGSGSGSNRPRVVLTVQCQKWTKSKTEQHDNRLYLSRVSLTASKEPFDCLVSFPALSAGAEQRRISNRQECVVQCGIDSCRLRGSQLNAINRFFATQHTNDR